MTATSVFPTPDSEFAVITFYQHKFVHNESDDKSKGQFKVEVNLIPEYSVSLTPAQANALAKSLEDALKGMGKWQE